MASHLATVRTGSPEEFVDALYARSEYWRANPGQWVFRGHGDATWPLLPSAFRDTALLMSPAGPMRRGTKLTVAAQVTAELHTLHMFLGRADAGGLPFAKYDDSLFNYSAYLGRWQPFFKRIEDDPTEWPLDDVLPNLALAQHYGISTRLIDWTTSATVAGYFAARHAAEAWHQAAKLGRKPSAEEFCLWALRTEFLDWAFDAKLAFASTVRVPRAHNENLHAQSGLFVKYTPHVHAPKGSDSFAPLPFDEMVSRIYDELVARKPDAVDAISPVLMKITTPLRFAPAVLRVLGEMGMNAAAIFPGYKGAADAVLERELWL